MAWVFTDGANIYTLAYGPKAVDYMIVGSPPALRKKYNVIKTPMNGATADSLSHIEIYPTYTMYWPLVTSSLYSDLSAIPMHKTIILTDSPSNIQFNIQITGKAVSNMKTINNSEVIRSVLISFRAV